MLREFGRRAAFLEPDARAALLSRPDSQLLTALVGATDAPAALRDWLEEHSDRFDARDLQQAMRALGVHGIQPMLRSASRGGRSRSLVRERLCELGTVIVEPLATAAQGADPALAATALDLLGDTQPVAAMDVFVRVLDAESSDVRAAAARGIARAIRGGAEAQSVGARLIALLDDEAAVRAAALKALAATGEVPDVAIDRARASLRDDNASVRIAAAEALARATGDLDEPLRVLRAELDVPAQSWGWLGGGGTPARTEDEYSDEEALWTETARAIGRIGAPAAPLARSLAWAALRHGEPRMQRIIVDAIQALGPDAAPATDLLLRLAVTRSGWLGFQETVGELDESLANCLRGLGVEPPDPLRDF